jgi:hypothetical protein
MNNSKLLGLITLITMAIYSCSSGKEKVIEGDLCFKRIDLYCIFDWPDSTLTKFEHEMLQVNSDTFNRNDKDFSDLIKYAINKKLTRQPYVWIIIEGKEFRMFLDRQGYDKLENYKWFELTNDHKKIHIKAVAYNVSFKDLKAVRCTKLLDIEEIDGETKYE